MKCQIKIVESVGKYSRELNERIRKGTPSSSEKGIVMTPETFSKVFSPERIKLLQRIAKNNITSIYQLAQELDKPYEVVFRNVKYLSGLGLIEIKEKENKKIPFLSHHLSIEMFPQIEAEA